MYQVCTPYLITFQASYHLSLPVRIDHEENMFSKFHFPLYHVNLIQFPSVPVRNAPFIANATPTVTVRNLALFLVPMRVGHLKKLEINFVEEVQVPVM